MSEWISVKSRLPNPETEFFKGGTEGSFGCSVVVPIDSYNTEIAYFDDDDQCFWINGMKIKPKCWYPIPEPPKDNNHE